MDRRNFVKICGSTVALIYSSPRLLANTDGKLKKYNRVLLSGKDGKPLMASQLVTGVAYLFHYPFAGTPSFLIDLGKQVKGIPVKGGAGEFDWPGGVGNKQSVVAFSAICSHQFSYPTKKVSFINYQHGKSKAAEHEQVIVCCAHQTVFDPTQGAKVITGPTTKPLTTIVLEHDKSTDRLYAVGTMGEEQYKDYFRAYKRDLIEQYGRGTAKQDVEGQSKVIPLTEYTAQQILC